MRRSLAAFGLGATAGAAVCALVTSGLTADLPTDLTRTVERITRPAAAATEELPAFDSCEELRTWYVEAALDQVGPWGWSGRFPYAVASDAGGAERIDASAGTPVPASGEAVGSSDTGTNVQEADVDEPDVAKTDGSILVRLTAGRALEIFAVEGDEPRLLSRIRLPGRHQSTRDLLLVGDTVLVVGEQSHGPWPAADLGGRIAPPAGQVSSHLYQVDVTDPGAPVLRSHRRVDGRLVAAREYGEGVVRAVVSTGLPPLDFVLPHRSRGPEEAERLNRRIVRAAGIEEWLPSIADGDGLGRRPLVDCADVRHPERPSGFGTLSVLTFGIDQAGALETSAITAAGDLVYSSTDRLYVATLRSGWGPVPVDAARPTSRRRPPSTEVHAFALEGTSTTYAGSGAVRGTVKDRWSFDEHDGCLRVATALGDPWNPRENAITVLDEDAGRLRPVGFVDGMGEREQIQSVRWFGDLAVLVTFRQVDPLYTVDLSDPAAPRTVGELKIRGFSDYLHPVGGDLLLGLGQDATARGRSLGAQAAVFDLSTLEDVTRADTVSFRRATSMPVGWEPRTFSYLPELRLGLVPVEDWHTGGTTLVGLHVGADGSLTRAGSWDLDRRWGGWRVRTLPLGVGRVALVDREVRILDLG